MAELLAALVELVDHGNRLTFAINKKKGTKMPEPVHVIRPGEVAEKRKPKRKPTHEEIVAFFGGGKAGG